MLVIQLQVQLLWIETLLSSFQNASLLSAWEKFPKICVTNKLTYMHQFSSTLLNPIQMHPDFLWQMEVTAQFWLIYPWKWNFLWQNARVEIKMQLYHFINNVINSSIFSNKKLLNRILIHSCYSFCCYAIYPFFTTIHSKCQSNNNHCIFSFIVFEDIFLNEKEMNMVQNASNCDICDTPTNIMFFRFLLKVVLCAHLDSLYKSPFPDNISINDNVCKVIHYLVGTTRDETTTSRLLVVLGCPGNYQNGCCCWSCPSITTDLILDSFFFFCLKYTLRQNVRKTPITSLYS